MSRTIQISLKAGERIYINGAVVRVDRKVTLELLNDVTFLLEGHVLQIEETTTPLRQIYFVIQMMLMDPKNADNLLTLANELLASAKQSFKSGGIPEALEGVSGMINEARSFDALRTLRGLFPVEDTIMARSSDEPIGTGPMPARGLRLAAEMPMPAAAAG